MSTTISPRLWITITALISSTLLVMTQGCVTQPTATVSNPGVYTSLQLRAVQLSDSSHKPANLQEDMQRFFATTPSYYTANSLRMDAMLDNYQRLSGFAQASQNALAVDIAASLRAVALAHVTTTQPSMPTTQPTTLPSEAALSETLKTLINKQVDGTAADSPFDLLDRVSDFYLSYLVKNLRNTPDARVTDVTTLIDLIKARDSGFAAAASKLAKNPHPHGTRLIVLYFQAAVDPGTAINTMTGVKVEVVDARRIGSATRPSAAPSGTNVPTQAGLVNVVRLHPSRNYDVASTLFAQDLQASLALTGRATIPTQVADVNVSGARGSSLDAAERQKFLSRIGKAASYANAGNHEFGWNFYPSNIQVVDRNVFEVALGFLFGAPSLYKVEATLEGGGRDCLAFLEVPYDLESIDFKVASFSESLDAGGRLRDQDLNWKPFSVQLPPYAPEESVTAGRNSDDMMILQLQLQNMFNTM